MLLEIVKDALDVACGAQIEFWDDIRGRLFDR